MTTKEIANKLVEYCRKGDYQTCYKELYSKDIESIEPDGRSVKGFEALAEKGKQWQDGIEEVMDGFTGDPVVGGNWFSVPMGMKLKRKGVEETIEFEEIAVYQVKEGKIVQERFFYDVD